jgi:hypothetical protein
LVRWWVTAPWLLRLCKVGAVTLIAETPGLQRFFRLPRAPLSLAFLHERHRGRSDARSAVFIAGLAVLLSGAAPARPDSDVVVVRGEVVETACYVMGNRRGEEHRECGIACARAGQPLGILDEKTKTLLFLVLDRRTHEPSNPLLEHVAARVEVRGRRIERGGINGIVVQDVKSLGRRPRT